MSLFKVVGNYYEDILDYFTREYKKYDPGFDPKALEREYLKYQDDPTKSAVLMKFAEQFRKLFDIPSDKVSKKTEVMKLLGKIYMRLDRIQLADWSYWEGRKSSYSGLLAIMIIMLLIILVIVVYLAIQSAQEETDTVGKTQKYIAYFIVYSIVFTGMVSFIITLSESAKMAEERGKANRDQFTNFNLLLVPNMQIQMFFTSLGYLMTNNNDNYERIKKNIGKASKASNKNAKGGGNCPVSATSKVISYMDAKDPCKNKTNFHEIYDAFKADISSYIFQFYNYGYGYTMVKRAVVKSNTSFMLKEVRKVLSFHYYLLNRKGVESEKLNIENAQKVLDQVLIDKLDDMKINDFLKNDGTASDIQQAFTENKNNNPDFVAKLKNWTDAVSHLAVFVYALYLNEDPKKPNFAARSIAIHSPLVINDSNGNKFLSSTRQYFVQKYETNYKDMLVMRASASQPDAVNILVSEMMNECRDYMTTAFNELILVTRGTNVFALEDAFINDQLTIINKSSPFALLDENYRNLFLNSFKTYLMPKIRDDVYADMGAKSGTVSVTSMINYKVGLVVEGLAKDLAGYNINIRENSTYIINKLIEKVGSSDKMLVEIYNQILNKLDAAIEIKQKMLRRDDKINPRFVNSAEFTTRLDNLLFEDLFQGLESFYLYEILNDFYMEVSSAISGKEMTNRTEHNIFYEKERRFKIAQFIVAMVSIILIECFGYYMLSWGKNMHELVKAGKNLKPDSNDDTAVAEYKLKRSILRTKYVNATIKLIIPLALVIFLIAMFNSYFKKAKAKFEFNRETIETNTSELLDSISKLDTLMGATRQLVNKNNFARVGDITVITEDTKNEIYKHMIDIVKNYENCNYILNISRSHIPFPYTEITVDAFMMFATVMCFVYVLGQMNPMGRLRKVKELNKRKDELAILPDAEMAQLLNLERACNAEDLDNIVFSLKIIVFSFIFMFLIFYTVTIVTSTSEFKAGLYNSGYYEDSKCYTG